MAADKIRRNKSVVKILACDPSLNGTAYHYMLGDKVIESWYFTDKKNAKNTTLDVNGRKVKINAVISERKSYDRVLFNKQVLIDIIKHVQPDYVSMEDYSLGSKGHVYQIGELGGVLRTTVLEHHIPLRLYEPTKVKKFGTTTGGANKSQVVVAVLKNWEKIDYSIFGDKGEDLADAYVIGQLLLKELELHEDNKLIENLPKYLVEVFTGVSKAYPVPLLRRAFIRW